MKKLSASGLSYVCLCVCICFFLNFMCKDSMTYYEERSENKVDKQKSEKTESYNNVRRHVGVGYYQPILRCKVQL